MRQIVKLLALVAFTLACLPLRAQDKAALEKVLTQMDTAAASFKTLEANFVWDQYTVVVRETETSKGRIYFRRQGAATTMLADITEPNGKPKIVLYEDSKIQVYQPEITTLTVYNTNKHKAEVESFLVLGFGGRGHDLLKAYEVKYLGTEKVLGVDTAKLELVPKSTSVHNNVARILLWIDPARGISLQQQLFDPEENYRLAKYTDIQLNQKIPDSTFKLKTTDKTKVLSPQG